MGGVPTFLTDGVGAPITVVNGAIAVTTGSASGIPTPVTITPSLDNGTIDAFGRQRVSQPTTLLDSKLVGDNRPLIWDDAEVSGGGTSSTYNISRSDVAMSVTANTAGQRVRQTFRSFNYHTAKSQLIFATFTNIATSVGNTKRVGYFHENSGLFLQSSGGVLSVVVRSKVSGSVVDTTINQANWNIDKLDGTGTSGFTLDETKSNILMIDFEWLGVGRVRFGFVINGQIIYVHAVNHANTVNTVYMGTPNQPLRYEITNNGVGAADTFYSICASVSTEGERDKVGFPMTVGNDSTVTLSGTSNTWAMVGIRLKSTHQHSDIRLSTLQAYATSADGILVTVHVNPTLNSTPTWTSLANSAIDYTLPGLSQYITSPGSVVYKYAVFGKTDAAPINTSDFPLLGNYIDGTPTTLFIGMKAITTNPKSMAFIGWREL